MMNKYMRDSSSAFVSMINLFWSDSSIVKWGYQGYFKLLCFFLREDFTRTKKQKKHKKHKKHKTQTSDFPPLRCFFMRMKSIKSIKSTKSTKRQTSDFLPLRCFYAHKNAVFFVSHTKKHKKHKNHEDANKWTSGFPHLRCFLCT